MLRRGVIALLVAAAHARADGGATRLLDYATKSGDFLWQRLAFICDTFGPRLSGSDALERAIDHIVRVARDEDGLAVTEEPVLIPKWVRGREYARLVGPVRQKELPMVGLGMSVGTPGGRPITADALVVNSFEELTQRAAQGQTQGKIIVFNWQSWDGYGNTVKFRYDAAPEAKRAGGVAALVRSIAPFSLQTPHTGTSARTEGLPAAAITIEDALLLRRMQERGQRLVIEMQMEANLVTETSPSRNVVIELRGSEFPEEHVVIGGHIDSWDVAEGAIDDGGGALAGWEALRLISALGLRPRRTIRAVMCTHRTQARN